MKLSTLLRLEENFHLDRKTLVDLRWIAIIGQLVTVNFVYLYLNLKFPIIEAHIVILLGLITNLFLQFRIKVNQLKDFYSILFLVYDLIQLSFLLYLTGGVTNPFSILLIVPAIVSSTFLSIRTPVLLCVLTIISLLFLNYFYLELPGLVNFNFPDYYTSGIVVAIIVGLIFLSYFGIKFTGESKKRSSALDKLQEVMAKEYELESLDGLAAAAAHSLGTPLSTIKIITQELSKQFKNNKDVQKDIELLSSQVERCNQILKKLSLNILRIDYFIFAYKNLLILRSYFDQS